MKDIKGKDTLHYSLKDLKFEMDLSKANYQLDALQNKILQTYIRQDTKFRKAFVTNYTAEFLQFFKDKARLKEPISLSVLGQVRSGKSYSMITLASILMALYGKEFTIDYICGNSIEYLEKLKIMPEEKLLNSCFLIDEEKQGIYSIGSIAKKMKLSDVMNITAINNVSTIMLNPVSWQNKEAMYGLRTFGRCFETKTCRLMLYNLQSGGHQAELPMGNVYLPIFTNFLPKDYAVELERQYLVKKMEWVRGEQRGEGDVLAEVRKKSAENFMRDKNFLQIKKRKERLAFITNKLGSEWTSKECEDILTLTSLLEQELI
jgi:hypothetical protein